MMIRLGAGALNHRGGASSLDANVVTTTSSAGVHHDFVMAPCSHLRSWIGQTRLPTDVGPARLSSSDRPLAGGPAQALRTTRKPTLPVELSGALPNREDTR